MSDIACTNRSLASQKFFLLSVAKGCKVTTSVVLLMMAILMSGQANSTEPLPVAADAELSVDASLAIEPVLSAVPSPGVPDTEQSMPMVDGVGSTDSIESTNTAPADPKETAIAEVVVKPLVTNQINGFSIDTTEDNMRLIFDVSAIPKYQIYHYTNPNRVVIDLFETQLTEKLSLPEQKPDILKGMRTALRFKNSTRIVLDLTDKVTSTSFVLEANDDQGSSLAIDIALPSAAEKSALLARLKDQQVEETFVAAANTLALVTSKKVTVEQVQTNAVYVSDAILPQADVVVVAANKQKMPTRLSSSAITSGKTTTATQESDNLYRRSVLLLEQGRVNEAREMLRYSLAENPHNLKARQAIVGLLVDSNRVAEASQWLKEGLRLSPIQSSFSMVLARLQIESGDNKSALDTLESGLSFAGDEANYNGFYAAIVQRDQQHKTAIQHYLTALEAKPTMPTWLVGLGISLQAEGQQNEASLAYQRAVATNRLTPELTEFVELRLKRIVL